MISEIKNRVESELKNYIRNIDKSYSLTKISPLLFKSIKDFISRKGKRLRPTLFIIGYLGFAKKAAAGLYRTAVSLELLHDFLLVHDDIIDKSLTRRGRPSLHEKLNRYLSGYKNLKFKGQDLAIVVGDVIYAMAVHAFLSVKEDMVRKEMALKKFTDAVFYTASGEFIELLYGTKDIDEITKDDIYKIYDLKTANYTFASPLTIGATLAGAEKSQIDLLFNYGAYLGRAFQIKDDILGMFGAEEETGKSNLTDLKEAKKTILIWYAYSNTNKKNKHFIKRILSKIDVDRTDLLKMRRVILTSGALDFAQKEIYGLIRKTEKFNGRLKMHREYRDSLTIYAKELLLPPGTDKFS